MKQLKIDPKDRTRIMEAAAEYLLNDMQKCEDPLTSPGDTERYLSMKLAGRKYEHFGILFLNTRHSPIAFEELFHGTIDGATVYPRVIAERCLTLGAAAVILAHNHPSGVAEPSLADQVITRRVKEALALLDIRLLDHIVIGNGTSVSMAERGMV